MDTDELSDNVTCAVCNEVYTSDDCKPVFLPCGHTFCRQCLQKIQGRGELKCPNCRKAHRNTLVNDLPLNFSLLSISENVQHLQELQICSSHNDKVRFWCAKCSAPLCDVCIIYGHRGDSHEIVKYNDHLNNEREQSKKELDGLLENITALQHSAANNVSESILSMIMSRKLNHDVTLLRTEVSSHSQRLQNCSQISTLTTNKEIIQNFRQKISKISCFSENIRKGFSEIEKEYLQLEETTTESIHKKAVDKITEVSLNIDHLPTEYLNIASYDGTGRYALMTLEENKVHLNSFCKQIVNSDVIIKWNLLSRLVPKTNPEVFLELTANKKCLGRIYIRLWGHLRRAQHFLALCLGSLGPTFSGMCLLEHKVWKNAEVLIGGSYASSDGHAIMRGLMKNLEWGGDSAGYCNKGHIVSFSKGNPDIDSVFAIVTNATESSYCKCPFGEVVSGLDVATMASQYDPIKRVKISRCGIILPLQGH